MFLGDNSSGGKYGEGSDHDFQAPLEHVLGENYESSGKWKL